MSRRKKLVNHSVIPQHDIENIARVLLPDILAYYESEKGQREFAKWKAQRDAAQNDKNAEKIAKRTVQAVLFARIQFSHGVYSATAFRYVSRSPFRINSAYANGSLVVIDEVIQFRPLVKVVCHFVLHGGAVNCNHAAVRKSQLHAAVSILNSQLLIFFMVFLLILFQLWFSRPSWLGFWTLQHTVLEVRIFKLLKKTNNPNLSPITKTWFGLYCFGRSGGI